MGYGKTYKTKWLEDLSGNQGTANQVLISTSAGIAWATASTVIGGPYLPLSGGTMTGNTTHGDNVKSLYGTGGDLEIYHDGSNSYIKDVGTGYLNISSDVILSLSNSANELYFLAVSNSGVKLYYDNSQRFETTPLGISVTGNGIFTGNVGIGTTGPLAKIHTKVGSSGVSSVDTGTSVVIESDTTNYLRFLSTDSSLSGLVWTTPSDNFAAFLRYGYNTQLLEIGTANSNDGISFSTGNGSEKMRILSTGNVGIGTTSPTRPLHVNAGALNFVAEFQSTDDKASILIQDDDTLNYIHSQDGYLSLGGQNALSASNLNIKSSDGNVGIGTTSPGAKLDVAGTGNFTGLVSGITPVAAANFATKSYVDAHGGGTGPFLPLAGGTMTGNLRLNDTVNLLIGSSTDLVLAHNGSNSYISNYTGDLYIEQSKDDGDIIFKSDNGSGGTAEYLRLDGGITSLVASKDLLMAVDGNGGKLKFGASQDLIMFHDGSNSYIADVGTGALFIDSSKTNFQINGSTVMNINFDSKVGIGTTNPDEKLRVDGNIKSAGDFIGAALKLGFAGSANITTNDTNEDLLINPNGSGDILMQTTSTGNVGIGTTAPDSSLDVVGTNNGVSVQDTENASGWAVFRTSASGSPLIGFNQNRDFNFGVYSSNTPSSGWVGNRMTIKGSGKVGIGTTSPASRLEVNMGDASGNRLGFIGDGSTTGSALWTNWATGASYLDFRLGGITDTYTKMRINSSGNVGIGTTSPGELLVLKESGSNDAKINILKSDGSQKALIGYDNGNGGLINLFNEGGNRNVVVRGYGNSYFNGGNVGIGTTSPIAKLHIDEAGTSLPALYIETARYGASIIGDGTSNSQYLLNLQSNGGSTDVMRVQSSGNVGIGTTSPDAILHVKGSTNTTEVKIDTDNNALGDNAFIKFNAARAQVGWIDAAVTLTDGGGNKDIKLKVNTGSIFLQTNNTSRLTVADGGNVGIGTTSPNSTALLDVSSTTKGVLLPRMSTTQINAISSPAEGLTVYNTVLSTLCFFNGVSWQKVTSTAM